MRNMISQTRSGLGYFIVVLLAGLMLSFGAVAGSGTAPRDDPCAESVISADEAKDIAAHYLDGLGYEQYAPGSNWHFSLRESTCVNGQWQVQVDLGAHTRIKKKRLVLVNCRTGEVDDHFAEGEDLAAK